MQYCFSTATMLARTLVGVTLYVQCLSCYWHVYVAWKWILWSVCGVRAIECFQQERQGEPQHLLNRSDNEKRNEMEARFGCIKARNTDEVIEVIGIGTGCHICVITKNVAGYSVVSDSNSSAVPRISYSLQTFAPFHSAPSSSVRLRKIAKSYCNFCRVCLLFRPCGGKNSAHAGQIFMKFDIWGFFLKNLARKAKFD